MAVGDAGTAQALPVSPDPSGGTNGQVTENFQGVERTAGPSESAGSQPRLLVIEHESQAGPGRFGDWLVDAGACLSVIRPYLGEPVPETLDAFDGLIVLGGSSGPLEDDVCPWLPATRALLRASIAASVPSFNICLGGELLAAAVGGETIRRRVPQIGAYRVHAREEARADPVFAVLPEEFATVLWHQEEMALPEGAVHLVDGTDAAVQAFRLGECTWGTQFHPETDGPQAESWGGEEDLVRASGKSLDEIVAEVDAAQDSMERTGRLLAKAFLDEVVRRNSWR